jgi:FixJ family two-component response regulator
VGSSGLADNAVVARAMNNGIRHFVAKPYTAEALLQKIHDALQETGPR